MKGVILKSLVAVAVIAVSLAGFGQLASAAEGAKPLQIALFNPIQLVPEEEGIKGFGFNFIYGKNAGVTG
ncbi:MAG TPA: hypothetical protein P5246_07835, partial [Candidatus Omnitrophota bacterium]|nr:hypothetical protein [Candidatus Omnitrophota bacterium]